MAGPGKNLRLAADLSPYFFVWISTGNSGGYSTMLDPQRYPGRLPEPVRLVEPLKTGENIVLTCQPSRHAIGYELLMGNDPYNVDSYQIISATVEPPQQVLTRLPEDVTWWTIRAHNAYGSTIHADPKRLAWPE